MSFSLLALAALSGFSQAAVVVNEIMYHPPSELTTEEWVELYNTGAAAVDLSGWKFTNGVTYTFPAGTSIGAGGYLVVTANPAIFHAKYPAVANYIASTGWQTLPNSGILSNSSNRVELTDNLAVVRDSVKYSDDGDWAVRKQDTVADFGHKGWGWDSTADGLGKSLELINPALDNNVGQNWLASLATDGTPGAANGVAAADIAPFILNVAHFPIVPTHNDAVTVTAKITDELTTGLTVTVHYRNDGAASFTTATMFDDGAHGDAAPGDGVYGASLPVAANGTIVEFYVQAVDAGAHSRTWPAPALNAAAAAGQFCNCLYQVDDTVYAGAMPFYKMVMRAVDDAELTQINTDTPAAPFATSDQTLSHAKMNATWITSDGTGVEFRYLDSVRNRGHGSRSRQPQSYNIAFPNADTWKGVTSLNLNTQYTYSQLFGSALFRKAGLPCPDSRQVQLRVNAVNPAAAGGVPSFGFYVANEVEDSDFAGHHYPLDSSGNIYRGNRTDSAPPANTLADAYLEYQAPAGAQQAPDPFRTVYFKHTNSSEDNWTDLIALTQALAKGHSNASLVTSYDAGYQAAVEAVVNVEEWMQFFAAQTLVNNMETNISRGFGDDFYLYFGVNDPRAIFIPYDLDTICGQGDTSQAATTPNLFRMGIKDDAAVNGATPLNAFMKHPAFAPIYYKHFKQLLDGPFVTANFNALVDEILTGVAPQAQIDSIKAFQAARTAFITGQIPLVLSVTSATTTGGTALAVSNGYPLSAAATCALNGKANAITTRSVKVNGVAATWTAWTASWTANPIALHPGINPVVIQTFDAGNAELERLTYAVWYDDASVATAGGTLGANTNWTAAGGPYRLTSNLIVPAGITLTIGPGTTVYCANGASAFSITVNGTGKILATGTDAQRIVFTREPGATVNWTSLDFINTTVESTLAYVTFDFCAGSTIGSHNAQCHVNNAIVFFDHLAYPANPAQNIEYISFDASSFIVQNSNFPSYPGSTGPESLHGINGIKAGGYGIFRDNYFGHTWGFNDTIDFTGGNRPGPILQFINNVFDGASDDCLDLDSTDAWIEGNIFLHVHRDPTRTDQAIDTGSAISGGVDTVGQNSDWTIINNLFYDVDHVFLNKGNSTTTGNGGGRVAFLYNTVIHVAKENSGTTAAEIAAFDWSDDNIVPPDATIGSGMYAAHNIIYDCSVLNRLYFPANHTIIMDNNILSVPWVGSGSGNQVVDPRLNVSVLKGTPVANVTAAQLRLAAQLLPDSPAIGTGFGGRNIGGLSPHGIAIGGGPTGTTSSTGATFTVGPAGTFNWGTTTAQPWGWTAYKYKIDGGAFSSEIAVTNNSPFTSPATISLTGLANGPHTLYVTGRNDAGYYQDDTFVYPAASGTPAVVSASQTWTVDTAYLPPAAQPNVRLNEVLAKNVETLGFSGVFPDICELYNAGGASADLSGWGLTDNSAIPYKYAIPNGTTLGAGQYLVIYLSSSASVPSPKTGFALKDTGDTLTLTKSPAAGGAVADSVAFGAQVPDYSSGRRPSDAVWDMCRPTFGAVNVVAAQDVPSVLKINEWLADARTLFSTDFIELFNPSTLPVNIGNGYLTNNPVEWVTQHQLRQLTFLAPSGYIWLKADGDTNQGPDHLDFKLTPTQGEIGLFDANQTLIDNIVYGPQSTDVSQGRSPNGTGAIVFFNQPTPGAPNPGNAGTSTATVNLVPATQVWKYFASATAAPANDGSGRTFINPLYTDTAWTSGGGGLYIESSAFPVNTDGFAKTTLLPPATVLLPNTTPYQTYYFRTHFTFNGPLAGATLSSKLMCDDGCVLYLNGVELTRIRMAAGAVAYSTLTTGTATDDTIETVSLPTGALVVGDNVLVCEVHQSADQGGASPSSDITWAIKLDATVTSATGALPVVINEVLPINTTLQNPDGSFAGWVELLNTSASAVDLTDVSLTNDVSDPRKFVFPSGTTIPASGYLVVYCNALTAVSATNTGYALTGNGGAVYLFNKLTFGGGLVDNVVYGLQVPSFSVGRIVNGNGPFVLNVPTRGATNAAAGLGAIGGVKINEWFASPAALPGWFELYNTGSQPVLLAGNFLTDNLTNRTKYLVPPLTFIGGTGATKWLQLFADNDNGATPGHVNFTIDPAGESLGLFAGNQVQLDAQNFGAQAFGISQGRLPDGTGAVSLLNPTPASANQSASTDSDGDGIPNWWENAYGLNAGSAADATLDADGDGQSNRAEYLAGTNPNSAASHIAAALFTTATPGQYAVRFTAITGKTYTVRYKNALTDATWTKLADVPAQGADTLLDVNDPAAGAQSRRFYQVVTPQQP